jgi:hypothetical protein
MDIFIYLATHYKIVSSFKIIYASPAGFGTSYAITRGFVVENQVLLCIGSLVFCLIFVADLVLLYVKTFSHLWQYLAEFFVEWEMFQINVVQKIRTYFMSHNVFFRKSRRLWDSDETYEGVKLISPNVGITAFRNDRKWSEYR